MPANADASGRVPFREIGNNARVAPRRADLNNHHRMLHENHANRNRTSSDRVATRDPAVDTENIENTTNITNNNNNIVQISAQENTEHQLQVDWSNVENDANFANQRRPTARELRRDRDTAERIRIYLKVVREQLSQLAVVFGI